MSQGADEREQRADWRLASAALHTRIEAAFDALIVAAQAPSAELDKHPADGGWSAREVLEHVALTDHYLLILARKIADKSAQRVARGEPWPAHPPRFTHIAFLGEHATPWMNPEHMTPNKELAVAEIVRRLREHRSTCIELIDAAPEGEGSLHRIRMSMVQEDDKLDLYQFLALIAVHAERHYRQIQRGLAD